ncbi:MAG: cobalamin biosynthesis protein CbiM [Planctomycetota bacterium]|nr:MAG: cobalamin biosynthesis protein CbiM [Planctomycetota bacterium]
MHMQDALLSLPVAGTFCGASAVIIGYSARRAQKEFPPEKIPLMGVMGAFVFAAQMVNFPVFFGSSGHLVGGTLLAILLGPFMAMLTITSILIIQCLLFQDGGLLALGTNIFNMAILSVWIGYGIFRLLIKSKEKCTKKRLFLATFLAGWISVFLSSLMVPLEISLSQVSQAPLSTLMLLMGIIHLLIGMVEGLITATVLLSLARAHPKFLPCPVEIHGKASSKAVIAAILCISLLLGGGLSLLASNLPDGLEWSISKWNPKIVEKPHPLAQKTEKIQKKISIFPDYSHPKYKAKFWTSLAGIVGTIVTLLFVVIMSVFIKGKRVREKHGTS